MVKHTRSWIELSKLALLNNIKVFRSIVGSEVRIMAVVKANAYGHGVGEISRILEKESNVNWFGVDSIEEAIQLRSNKVRKPILILGYTPLFKLEEVVTNKFSLAVYNLETLKHLARIKKNSRVHIKIDTGMGRQGIKDQELDLFLNLLATNKHVHLEGVFTHFASADEVRSNFTKTQLKNFNKVLREIKKAGFSPKIIHSAATAGTLLHKNAHFSLIRAGIGTYGLLPSKEVGKIKNFKFRPVLSWKCYVAKIKTINKGESVGYGRTWIARDKRTIALVPVGYYDGYDRKLSNSGKVIVKGKYAPVIGRVSMNMMSVDVTGIQGVGIEDEVILLGNSKNVAVTADDIAQKIGSINYEVVTRINPSLPRVVV